MNNTLASRGLAVARAIKLYGGPMTAVEGRRSRHAWLCGVHVSARVGHNPGRGGWMGNRLAAK